MKLIDYYTSILWCRTCCHLYLCEPCAFVDCEIEFTHYYLGVFKILCVSTALRETFFASFASLRETSFASFAPLRDDYFVSAPTLVTAFHGPGTLQSLCAPFASLRLCATLHFTCISCEPACHAQALARQAGLAPARTYRRIPS